MSTPERQAELDAILADEAATRQLSLPGLVHVSERRYAVVEAISFTRTSVSGAVHMPVVMYKLASAPTNYAQALANLARLRAVDQAETPLCSEQLNRGLDGRLQPIIVPCILPAGHPMPHHAAPEFEEAGVGNDRG